MNMSLTKDESITARISEGYCFGEGEVCINEFDNTVIPAPKETFADLFDRGIHMFSEDYLADGLPNSIPSERIDL